MKRTIVIVDLVILACLAGFFIGRGTSHQISKYDERAEKSWKKAEQAALLVRQHRAKSQ